MCRIPVVGIYFLLLFLILNTTAAASPRTIGYAVIVQGKSADGEGLAFHDRSTRFVYRMLTIRGLSDEDIFFLNYNDTVQLPENKIITDALPSKAAMQNALTVWAAERMNLQPAGLCLVLIGPTFDNVFSLAPDSVTPKEISQWLDTLQSKLTGAAAEQEIVTVLGTGRAGVYIRDLSGSHRSVISATSYGELAYRGTWDRDKEGNIIRDGDFFTTEFFRSAGFGNSLKQCFEDAAKQTKIFTSTGSAQKSGIFYDDARQHPLLEDNGDGIGSSELGMPEGDGVRANTIFFGTDTGNVPEEVRIHDVSNTIFLGENENTADFQAGFDHPERIQNLWIDIRPPNYLPLVPGISDQVETDYERIAGTLNGEIYEWKSVSIFNTPGTWQLFYFTRDTLSGTFSPLQESKVCKAKTGNRPPDSFRLISPESGASVMTPLSPDWETTTDPDGDGLTYTLLLSETDTFTNPIVKEYLFHSTCSIGPEDGIKDMTLYYWKVQAVDPFGAIRESEIRHFTTQGHISISGWFAGNIYIGNTQKLITEASVRLEEKNTGMTFTFNTNEIPGFYKAEAPPGTYRVTVSADGYPKDEKGYSKTPEGYPGYCNVTTEIEVLEGMEKTVDFRLDKKGDLNGDGNILIEDINLLFNDYFLGGRYSCPADIDKNGMIDLIDMQKIFKISLGAEY